MTPEQESIPSAHRIIVGDCREALKSLEDESVNCVITSPPYWNLRAYEGEDGMIGREETWEQHVENIMVVMAEVKRVLRKDGTVWFNYGDAYPGGRGTGRGPMQKSNPGSQTGAVRPPGFKAKSLMLMPLRLLIQLVDEQGWLARSRIIWHKPSPMPESVKDRPTTAYEDVFLLSKQQKYWYDADAIKTPVKQSSLERFPDTDGESPNFRNGTFGFEEVNLEHKFSGRVPRQRHGQPTSRIHDAGNSSQFPEEHERKNLRTPTNWETHDRYHENDPRRSPKKDKQSERWDRAEENGSTNTLVNARNVWKIASSGFKGKHFATFPPKLIEKCLLAGCPVGGTVLDPFGGAGTVGMVAAEHGRDSISVEISETYVRMAEKRIEAVFPLMNTLEIQRH